MWFMVGIPHAQSAGLESLSWVSTFLPDLHQISCGPRNIGVAGCRGVRNSSRYADIAVSSKYIISVFFLCTFVTFTICCPSSHNSINKLWARPSSTLLCASVLPAIPSATGLPPYLGCNTQQYAPTLTNSCVHQSQHTLGFTKCTDTVYVFAFTYTRSGQKTTWHGNKTWVGGLPLSQNVGRPPTAACHALHLYLLHAHPLCLPDPFHIPMLSLQPLAMPSSCSSPASPTLDPNSGLKAQPSPSPRHRHCCHRLHPCLPLARDATNPPFLAGAYPNHRCSYFPHRVHG